MYDDYIDVNKQFLEQLDKKDKRYRSYLKKVFPITLLIMSFILGITIAKPVPNDIFLIIIIFSTMLILVNSIILKKSFDIENKKLIANSLWDLTEASENIYTRYKFSKYALKKYGIDFYKNLQNDGVILKTDATITLSDIQEKFENKIRSVKIRKNIDSYCVIVEINKDKFLTFTMVNQFKEIVDLFELR